MYITSNTQKKKGSAFAATTLIELGRKKGVHSSHEELAMQDLDVDHRQPMKNRGSLYHIGIIYATM